MIILTDEFTLKEGDPITVDEYECVLCEEQPVEITNGRMFKPWAAKTEGGYLPVVEILNETRH